MKLNLRNKFLLPTLIIAAVGLATTVIISSVNASKAIHKQIESELNKVAEISEHKVDLWVSEIEKKISSWSIISDFQDLEAISENPFHANELLAEFQKLSPATESLFITNDSGIVIA